MSEYPNCIKCNGSYTYQDGNMFVCPECAYEWSAQIEASEDGAIKDVNGNVLADGDAVSIVQDLKVKGYANAIKRGTKVKNIRLVNDPVDGHDIDCKIDGFGAMTIKSIYVKKLS